MSRFMARFAYGIALASLCLGAAAQAETRSQVQDYVNANIKSNGSGNITGPVANSAFTQVIQGFGALNDNNTWTGFNYFNNNPQLIGCVGIPVSTGAAPFTCLTVLPLSYLPIGTSGATIPLNSGNNTSSGNNTHNGSETFSGAVSLPAGTFIDPAATGSLFKIGPNYNGGVSYNAGDKGALIQSWGGVPYLGLATQNNYEFQIGVDGSNRLGFWNAPSDVRGTEVANLDNAGNLTLVGSQLTAGTGSFAAISYTNTPNLTGAAKFQPSAVGTGNVPALAVTRTTQGGNPSNQSNETLFVGTHLDFQSPNGFYWGISNQVQIDRNAAPNGNGAYAEAMRTDCEIGANIDQAVTCWGLGVRSGSNSTSVQTYNIGIEVEVDKNMFDAPVPASFSSNYFNAAFLASGGTPYATGHINEAAFLVNNFTQSGGFQAGFMCPKETGAHANIPWSCFYAASKSTYAIDIGDGIWGTGQVRGVGWLVDTAGGHSIYGTTPIGLDLRFGTFASSQITGTGFSVTPSGQFFAKQYESGAQLPTISTCGTSPPAASTGSSNNGGQFTLGTGTTAACTVTFASAFANNAYCTVTPATAYTGTYYVSASSNTAFTVTLGTGTASVKFNYSCMGT